MPEVAMGFLGLYLLFSLISIAFYKGVKIPIWLAWLNLSFTAITPFVFTRMIVVNETASYATWFVVGLATLMGITAFRGHVVIGWLGFLTIALQIIIWGGVGTLLNAGVVGALLMVFAGHASGYAIRTADRQASEEILTQQTFEVEAAKRSTARKVRQERIQQTLQKADPFLTKITEQGGKLSEDEAIEARLLEAELRDLIRGRGLINERVSEAANKARARGVKVELLDEGGLEEVDPEERSEILLKVAEALDSVLDGKITIRSPKGESWKVTIAAMSPSRDEPSLWERI
jgi:signal transduction histidine kinase